MILELLFLLIGWYLFCGVTLYGYAVVKTHEITGRWFFRIHKGYIGVCRYPRWLLIWLELLVGDLIKWKNDAKSK